MPWGWVRLRGMRRIAWALLIPSVLAAQIKITVQLSAATTQAFDKYLATEEQQMDWKARMSPKPGAEAALMALGENPLNIPDGLIHDWAGAVLIPGAQVDKALAMFRDYADYKKVFAPDVLDSTLLSHDGNRWNSRLRIGR